MITLSLQDKHLAISLNGTTHAIFSTAINLLKREKFRYNAATRTWLAQPFKYENIKAKLEELDTIEDKVIQEDLIKLNEGKPEQIIEPIRRIPDFTLMNYPPMIGKHPYENFQKDGIAKGINRSCYAYAWEMGSGKSYVASAIIAHRLYKYHDCSKVLFITTNIGVRNLYHELFKFIKDLDENKVKIADKDYRNPFDDPNTDIVVTSYNSFRLVCEYYKKQFKVTSKSPRKPFLPLDKWSEGKPLLLILDESHCVANPKSQQSHLIALHAPLFKYRYEFSGSYADKIEKSYVPYSILDKYLVYNLSYTEWIDKLANTGNFFSAYAINSWKREEVEKQNQRFTASYGNFYKTTDLVDLPDYIEKKIYIPMSPQHRAIYESVVVQDLANQKTTRDVINRFPYMMLSVDNPFLLEKHRDKFDKNLNQLLDNFKESYIEKYKAIDDILADHEKEKGIIWAIHPDTIHRLGEKYKKYNPICITGETDQKTRFDLVTEFKNGDHKLLIANIVCLNTSVTITEATFQVYVERSFDFTTYSQSTARAFRIGQTNNVHSYILLYDKSLDVALDRNLSNKGMLVEGLVKKEFLTQEQWTQIFNCTERNSLNF